MIIILILLFLSIKKARENERLLYEVEFYTDSLNRYTKVYNSESFSKLKKENKELYNRLKEKEALVEAVEFEWKYKYEGLEREVSELRKTDSLYTFKEETDTRSQQDSGYDTDRFGVLIFDNGNNQRKDGCN